MIDKSQQSQERVMCLRTVADVAALPPATHPARYQSSGGNSTRIPLAGSLIGNTGEMAELAGMAKTSRIEHAGKGRWVGWIMDP